jgi:hypothetical protein
VAALCLFAAAGATAFAVAASPHGSLQWSRPTGALLLGLLVSLALWLVLKTLIGRAFAIEPRAAAYAAMAGALIVLLASAGARTLLARTASESAPESERTQQAFKRWTLQAVPLLVRYKDTLALDASPTATSSASSHVDRGLLRRVEVARRQLRALELPVGRLARSAPADLRSFMPLLTQAVTLAVSAQSRYEAALAARASRSRALLAQANRLLRRSQQAMAAFSTDVNGVGGRLANG